MIVGNGVSIGLTRSAMSLLLIFIPSGGSKLTTSAWQRTPCSADRATPMASPGEDNPTDQDGLLLNYQLSELFPV